MCLAESAESYLVHPVLCVNVGHAAVQGIVGEDDDEVSRQLDAVQQILVELAGPEAVDVQEDGEPAQL